jgi:hypothetical protein
MPAANYVTLRNLWWNPLRPWESQVGAAASAGRANAINAGKRIVLLVHGFNVPILGARDSFQRFERHLENLDRRTFDHERLRRLKEDCCWVTWPGDSWVPFARGIAYWRKVGIARAAAVAFADYLRGLISVKQRPEIIIIAHSLGCRMVLEALRAIDRPIPAMTVVLMAAAVPVEMIEAGGHLAETRAVVEDQRVLYSEWDTVLANLFAPGQWAAARMGRDIPIKRYEAVGSRGLPKQGAWTRRRQMLLHDHGHYWSEETAAFIVASWLGVSLASDVPDRVQREGRSVADSQAPEDRAIQDRTFE